MRSISEAIGDEISGAAFRRLLRSGTGTEVAELAGDLTRPVSEIAAAVEDMSRQGRIRLDGQGRVVGAAGLSIGPDRHQIDIDDRRFWTWCAYDILGIFGALDASGLARSKSPLTGEPIEVQFRLGRPEPSNVVLFRPDDDFRSCCASVYEEWCPNTNFFESRQAAHTWSNARGLNGRVLTLAEATELAARDWLPLVSGLRVRGADDAS